MYVVSLLLDESSVKPEFRFTDHGNLLLFIRLCVVQGYKVEVRYEGNEY